MEKESLRRRDAAAAVFGAVAGVSATLLLARAWKASVSPSAKRVAPQLSRMMSLPATAPGGRVKLDSVMLHRKRLEQRSVEARADVSDARVAALAAMRDEWVVQLLREVMPFWMAHSPDVEQGGFFTCLDGRGECFDDTKYHWLQGRMVWTLSQLYLEVPRSASGAPPGAREPFAAAQRTRDAWYDEAMRGCGFLPNAELGDGTGRLWFSTSRDGSCPVHMQRKPYAAVFYAMGFLNCAKMMKRRRREAEPQLLRSAEEASHVARALSMFARLREWMASPALLREEARFADAGAAAAGAAAAAPWTKLGDLMCVCCLALDFHAALEEEEDPGGVERAALRAIMWRSLRQLEPHRHRCTLDSIALDDCSASSAHRNIVVFLENAPARSARVLPSRERFATPASRTFNPGSFDKSLFFFTVTFRANPAHNLTPSS